MKKYILAISITLNIALIAAWVAGHAHVRNKGFESAALHAQSETNLSKLYLGDS
jgi:uncharacterized alpha/beta hydrolase family protein